MKPEKRRAEYAAMRARCPCPTCPTYTECAKEREEKMFCIYGMTPDCIVRELKCICKKCPVHAELGFRGMRYCTRGAEKRTASRRF